MAAAIPFVVKAVVGYAVSKVVGKITGNELLGAVAGGFVGMGLSFDAATGAASWGSSGASGAASAASAASGAPEIVAGGAGLAEGAGMAGIGTNVTGTASVLGSEVGGAATMWGDVAPAITGGEVITGAAGAATQGGGGILSQMGSAAGKVGGFLTKNPAMAQTIMGGVSKMMGPDEEDMIKLRHKHELERMQKAEDIKNQDQKDWSKFDDTNRLGGVNDDLFSKGYRPQSTLLREGGYQPTYSNRVAPSRSGQLSSVYDPQVKEDEDKA